jgi:hypothetical protein
MLRRTFIKAGALTGMSMLASGAFPEGKYPEPVKKGLRVGIIGLDTSHAIAFTKTLNSGEASPEYGGYRVVAAYPQGSKDIESSVNRVPGHIEEIRKMGVEIVDGIPELLEITDVILLETNDGRPHLEQALPVFRAGKTVFIDKPVAGTLADAFRIFRAAEASGTPVFSSSSLRYMSNMDDILRNGSIGQVLGAEAYSPSPLEATHPDFFWYGIHGIEALFTVMGIGCQTVSRVSAPGADVVTGLWKDGRIGSFRGLRAGKTGYGGYAFGEKGIKTLGDYNGYDPLLKEIVKFFRTGVAPVSPEETLEIFTFMEAADESKRRGGASVSMDETREKALSQIE